MKHINHLPLLEPEDDRLGFNETYIDVVNFIEAFPNNQPYCMSINGSWGSGKSSMLNFIEKKLDKDKNIVIRFNPWEVLNEENLVATMFEELTYAIKNETYIKLKKKLVEYGRKVCVSGTHLISKYVLTQNGVDNEIAEPLSSGGATLVDSLFTNDTPIPLSVRKKELDKDLLEWATKENKKIVVIIDELDRLFPKEIVEIFKLIKASISFPGVFFLVAIDRKVIVDALRAVNISEPEDYLVKIFQQRFDININYQLRTLVSTILFPCIDNFQEAPKTALINSINAIVFLKDSAMFMPNNLSSGEAVRRVRSAYHDTNKTISNHLSIPRTFINFTSYTNNKWQNFYKNVFGSQMPDKRNGIAAFTIFLLHFIHPETVENHILGKREKPSTINSPETFNIIRYELLNILYPEVRLPSSHDPSTFTINYNDEIIHRAIYYLKRYPDHVGRF